MKKEEKKDIKAETRKALDKIEHVIVRWSLEDPIMLDVYCLVNKVADPNQKTLGISTKTNPTSIKFNPNFVNILSKERLECVLVQEGFKLLLKHPTTRFCTPRNISGLSSSVTVTPMSLGPLLEQQGLDDLFPKPSMFGLPDGQYYEEYFRRLMDKQEEVNQTIKEKWDSMTPQEKQDAIDNAMKGQGKGEKQEGQGGKGKNKEEGEDEGEGEGQEENQQGQGQGQPQYQDFNNQNDAMKEYFNPNSTNNMEWEPNEMFDADVENLVNERKDSTKDWGRFTGDMMGQIVAANSPKISWKEIVRRFSKSVLSRRKISTRMRINRRYDLMCPGSRREYDTKILFAVDVSGSMSDEDLAEGLAVMNDVCKHSVITWMQFDCQIKKIEPDYHKAKNNFKVYGRGGTDFQPVIDWANENKQDGVVIFTDGYASEPTKLRGNSKMLWLMHSKEQKPPCDWGYVAHLDRNER